MHWFSGLPRALPKYFAGRTFSICHANDVVCQQHGPLFPPAPHLTYPSDAAQAATLATSRLSFPKAVDRFAVTSYDRMAAGAPRNGYFLNAWQPFVAKSNRITYLGATVGNSTIPGGQTVGTTLTMKLCTSPSCSTVLAAMSPKIVNYGNTAATLSDVRVNVGTTYYVVWYQPARVNGATWVTYWWAGGAGISKSDQLQAVVRGYNA